MKPCRRCGELFPLEEFYVHPQMGDGHLNVCKACVKNRVRERYQQLMATQPAWVNAERERNRIRMQGKPPNQKTPEQQRRYRARYPEKYRARCLLSNAVRDGRIVRPHACERCGAAGRVQGHHEDYSRPLDVMWVCTKCHGEIHRKEAAA